MRCCLPPYKESFLGSLIHVPHKCLKVCVCQVLDVSPCGQADITDAVCCLCPSHIHTHTRAVCHAAQGPHCLGLAAAKVRHIHTHSLTHTFTHTHAHTHTQADTHTHSHTRTLTHTHSHACSLPCGTRATPLGPCCCTSQAHTHTLIHTYTHTHSLTHTHTRAVCHVAQGPHRLGLAAAQNGPIGGPPPAPFSTP